MEGNEDIYNDKSFLRIYKKSKDFTMTSIERAYSLYQSCKYIIDNKIKGDFVECGVWKGGSAIIMALTLKRFEKLSKRKIYLYDTFEGMPPPTGADVDIKNQKASHLLLEENKETSLVWSYATKDIVVNNLKISKCNLDNVLFIQGKVEETIPKHIPKKIALLRLDTDWYQSTLHELTYLYPKLAQRGVLIIDDYGHWKGCKKAVNEYFLKKKIKNYFHRIDYTGRLMVKI